MNPIEKVLAEIDAAEFEEDGEYGFLPLLMLAAAPIGAALSTKKGQEGAKGLGAKVRGAFSSPEKKAAIERNEIKRVANLVLSDDEEDVKDREHYRKKLQKMVEALTEKDPSYEPPKVVTRALEGGEGEGGKKGSKKTGRVRKSDGSTPTTRGRRASRKSSRDEDEDEDLESLEGIAGGKDDKDDDDKELAELEAHFGFDEDPILLGARMGLRGGM